MSRVFARRGFTLIELLIVIAIIGALTSVTYVFFEQGRMQARDEQRKADVEQISVAIRLYAEQYGEFPCETATSCSSHTADANGEIGAGGEIDSLLAPYLSAVASDPLGPGDANYLYYYDGSYVCDTGVPMVVVHAITLEVSGVGNWPAVCPIGAAEASPDANTYTVVVGPSSG